METGYYGDRLLWKRLFPHESGWLPKAHLRLSCRPMGHAARSLATLGTAGVRVEQFTCLPRYS